MPKSQLVLVLSLMVEKSWTEVKQQQSNPRLPSTLNGELRYTPSEKQLAPPFQPIENIINIIGDLVNPVFPPLVQIICALSLALFADVFRSD